MGVGWGWGGDEGLSKSQDPLVEPAPCPNNQPSLSDAALIQHCGLWADAGASSTRCTRMNVHCMPVRRLARASSTIRSIKISRPYSDQLELCDDACADGLGGRTAKARGDCEWFGITRGDFADLRSDKFVELHLTDTLQESKRARKTRQRRQLQR